MKKILTIILVFVLSIGTNVMANSHDKTIKIGIILDFTGPIKSLTPEMVSSAELAFKEASNSGSLLNGSKIQLLRADSTCNDAAAATAAAKDLISQDVAAIMGAVCPSVADAIISKVAVPNGVVMISPSTTSPNQTTLGENLYFFKTVPSDARSGQILADITKDKRIKNVAISYINNNYGKAFANNYAAALKSNNIEVTTIANHESDKDDYSSEVASLAYAGGDAVAVIGYIDQGGKGIIQASIDSGAFDTFILPDTMINQSLINTFGKDLDKSFGFTLGSIDKGANDFSEIAKKDGIEISNPYTLESYDAAALIVLAIGAGNSTNRDSIAKNVMEVANAPGTKIYPGELKKGLDLLNQGKNINYEGATGITFTDIGEAKGSFLELEIDNGIFKTIKQR